MRLGGSIRCRLGIGSLCCAVLLGCTTDGTDRVEPAPSALPTTAPSVGPSPMSTRLHTVPGARCRVPLPVTGHGFEARHFDPQVPLHQLRHQLTISRARQPVVRIDIWEDPAEQPLRSWVEQHLGFLLAVSEPSVPVAITPRRLPGLLLEQPRSPQALARLTALLAVERRVFRITCLDAEDPEARLLFDQLLVGFEPEVAP